MTCKSTLILSWLLLIGLAGCDHHAGELPAVTMKIGSKNFDIEIAATEPQQEKGLMKRDSMPSDHGMIFVFADDSPRQFWMKNTRFALDIIFLDSSGRVVSIKQMRAYDEHTTSSDAAARFAIELNDGAAAGTGIKVGDHVNIPASVFKP